MRHSEVIGRDSEDRTSYLSRCNHLMAMKEYDFALKDALKVIEIDGTYRMGYYKALDCLILIGNTIEAKDLVKKFRIIAPQIDTIDRNQVKKIERQEKLKIEIRHAFDACNYPKCLKLTKEASQLSPACVEFLIIKMVCLICLNRFNLTRGLAKEICSLLGQDLKIFEGLKSYYEGDLLRCLAFFDEISAQVARKSPFLTDIKNKATQISSHINDGKHVFARYVEINLIDNDKSLIDFSNRKIFVCSFLAKFKLGRKQFKDAIEVLEKCLQIDPSNKEIKKKLLFKIAQAQYDINLDVLSACHKLETLLKMAPNHVGAMILKARLLLVRTLYNDALRECEKILKINIPMQTRQEVDKLKEKIKTESELNINFEFRENSNHSTDQGSFHEEPEVEIHFEENKKSRSSTQYSFSAADTEKGEHFKEFIGKPKKSEDNTKQKAVPSEAKKKNEEACKEYNDQRYERALKLYSEAISLSPENAKFIINRSACYMAMDNFDCALMDALKAIGLDSKAWKGYLRAINCFLVLGDINLAKQFIGKLQTEIAGVDSIDYNEVPKLESLTLANMKVEDSYQSKNYAECLKNLETAMKIAKCCLKYRDMKTECLIMLQNHDEANAIITKALQLKPQDANMIYLQGLQFYHNGNLSLSISKFETSLKINSELKKAQQHRVAAQKLLKLSTLALNFYKERDFLEARNQFSLALEVDSSNKKVVSCILYNRGCTNFELRCFLEAFNDFSEALKIDQTHAKCLYKRAKTHFKLLEFEDCIIDCEESLRLESSDLTKQLLSDAKFNSTIAKKKSEYTILGVTPADTNEDVKKAFRRLSLQFHSDKHPNATAIDKKKLERKFQEVKSAYEKIVQKA